jgi:hypothetical protein
MVLASRRDATAPSPARDFGGERVEWLSEGPERISEPGEPCLSGLEPGFIERINTARAHGAHGCQAGLA